MSLDVRRSCNLRLISQGHAHNNLKDLTISCCPELESMPERMHIGKLLPALDKPKIKDCLKSEMFPEGGLPSNLKKKVDFDNCSKLITLPKGALRDNPSLKTLPIGKLDAESFPKEGLLPHSLVSMRICDCPNLKQLDYKNLSHLSLNKFVLHDCPSLEILPEEGLSKSISTLEIWKCPLLTVLPEYIYKTKTGEDFLTLKMCLFQKDCMMIVILDDHGTIAGFSCPK